MRLEQTALEGVKIIYLDTFGDSRGIFAETYDSQAFLKLGIDTPFVQDASSYSAHAGVVRGLHFQTPPKAQAKIVRVIRGLVFDVIVDLRHSSPTFGKHVSLELSAEDMRSVYIPVGFAHGFCTLEDDTEITYKMSDHFDPGCYKGLLWCDPTLGIKWPVEPGEALVSDKDSAHPELNELEHAF